MAAGTTRPTGSGTLMTAAIAALVIAAPTLLERLAPPFTPAAPLRSTRGRAATTIPGPPGGIRPGAMETLPEPRRCRGAASDGAAARAGNRAAIVHDGNDRHAARVRNRRRRDAHAGRRGAHAVPRRLGDETADRGGRAAARGRGHARSVTATSATYLPGFSLASTASRLTSCSRTQRASTRSSWAASHCAPDHLQPLAEYLPAVRAPGRHAARARLQLRQHQLRRGRLVAERLSGPVVRGRDGDAPLHAARHDSHDRAPAAGERRHCRPRPRLRVGRRRYRALPFRYTQTGPAGAVSTTAADMSRFMLALLGDGSLDGVRVLSPASRAALLQPQFRDHPRLPGVTYGFHEWRTHGRAAAAPRRHARRSGRR